MRLKRTGFWLIILLVSSLIFNVILMISRDREPEIYTDSFDNSEIYKYIIDFDRQGDRISWENENKTFPSSMFAGKDTIRKVELRPENYTLVCYFSIRSCQQCYERMLEIVREVFSDYTEREDIILLSNDFDYKWRDDFYGKKVYGSNELPRNGALFHDYNPKLFLIDRDNRVSLIHVYSKESPEMTKEYLTIVKRRFFTPVSSKQNKK